MRSTLHLLLPGCLLIGSLLGPGALAQPAPADPVGTWQGTLTAPGGTQLRLVLHVARDDEGTLTATLDSPDQGAAGIPAASTVLSGDTLVVGVDAVGGRYTGVVDGDRIAGTWSQGGGAFELDLARTGDVLPPRRPQTPQPPFPYHAEDVVYDNPAAAGVRLAGTFTRPEGDGPHPAVLLITGSGAQDRDETLAGHKPFLVLADHLTRRGIAVLRVDDRGTAASTGDFASATSEDFASDAWAGVRYLRSRPDVDAAAVGLVGHSEGGLVAPMVAAGHPEAVAFVVLLAGPGEAGHDLLVDQSRRIAAAAGAPAAAVEAQTALQRRTFGVLRRNPDPAAAADSLRPLVEKALRQQGLSDEATARAAAAQIRRLTSPWMRFFLFHDPAAVLRRVTVPVLALYGAKDLQVPPETNASAVEAALSAGGNHDVTVRVVPGLNHLFQTATTGAPTEYARIEETFAPAALDLIADWIATQVE